MSIISADKVVHKGLIYGILLPNNKIYIGQTKATINRRKLQHKERMKDLSRNSKLYEEMRKFGYDNCFTVLIENNIPDSLLDSREKFYIDSFEHTLNSTKGKTSNGGEFRKIDSNESILDIYEMLKDDKYQMKEIADKYNVSTTEISYINTGEQHQIYSKNMYPIRKIYKKLTKDEILEIVDLLKNYNGKDKFSDFILNIAKDYDKSRKTIQNINNGTTGKKFTKMLDVTYPIAHQD